MITAAHCAPLAWLGYIVVSFNFCYLILNHRISNQYVSIEEFDTWTHTWNDYFAITKLEKEPHSMQRANLMSHMSQEMRSVVEHILGIRDDTAKSWTVRIPRSRTLACPWAKAHQAAEGSEGLGSATVSRSLRRRGHLSRPLLQGCC